MCTIDLVAIAYVMHKAPYVFPILGVRKVEQLKSNIEALDIALSAEQIKYLESIFPFDRGFPTNFFVRGNAFPSLLF
jgi:aryl-alcohol dehydrogenase-like predicted oxidoreductase